MGVGITPATSDSSSSSTSTTGESSISPTTTDATTKANSNVYEDIIRKLWKHLEKTERRRLLTQPRGAGLGETQHSGADGVNAGAEEEEVGATAEESDGSSVSLKSERQVVASILAAEMSPEDKSVPLDQVLSSPRWAICGFPFPDPCQEFIHGGGLLAAKNLLYFLLRFPSSKWRFLLLVSFLLCSVVLWYF